MTDGDVPEGDPDSTEPHEDDRAVGTPTEDDGTPEDEQNVQSSDETDGSSRGASGQDDGKGEPVAESAHPAEPGDDQSTEKAIDDRGVGTTEGGSGDDGPERLDERPPDGDDAARVEEADEGDDVDLEVIEALQAEYEEQGAANWDPDDPEEDVEPVDWDDATVEATIGSSEGADDDGEADTADSTAAESDTASSADQSRDVVGPNPYPDSDEASMGEEYVDGRGRREEPYMKGQETEVPDRDPDHAPDDEEMPLAEHVEEMVRRLGVVLLLMAGVSAIVFPFGERIINVIWYSFLPGSFELCPTTSVVPQDPGAVIAATLGDVGAGPGVAMAESSTIKPACPRVYHPLATILARFKVATLAGFVIALPAVVYETYLFMRPGLFPRERRYYLAAVPTSLLLAAFGVAFAYLLVLPAIFTYFLYYSEGAADIAFSLTETFDLMVLMLGFFAAIFQIPLFIMLAIMMGITSRQWLADRRLLFWAAFAGIAFLFNPDPTGMAPFIIAATMIALFEGTLLLLSWTGSEGLMPSPEAVAARRPYAWLGAGVVGYLVSSAPLPAGFYDQLPGLVRGFIEANDLLGVTPLVVGGAIVATFELLVFLLNRYLPVGKRRRQLFTGRLSLRTVRTPVWIVSLVIGYFASPTPFLLARADAVALDPLYAGALSVGLIVAFEVLLAVWTYTRPDEDERLPLER